MVPRTDVSVSPDGSAGDASDPPAFPGATGGPGADPAGTGETQPVLGPGSLDSGASPDDAITETIFSPEGGTGPGSGTPEGLAGPGADVAGGGQGEESSLVPASITMQTAAGIGFDISYGFDNNAKGGRAIPVAVRTYNTSGEDFSGKLQFWLEDGDGAVVRYDYPVGLPGGGGGEISVELPLFADTEDFYVSLSNHDGRQILIKEVTPNISRDFRELFVGVLSDTPARLDYLDEVGVNYGSLRARVFSLDADALPEDAAGLGLLDVIVISDYDAGALSPPKLRTLANWVDQGGTLLLGGGARAKESFSPFADDLSGFSYGKPVEVLVNLGAQYAILSPDDAQVELTCVDILLPEGNVLMADDQMTLLASAPAGGGAIAVAAFDICSLDVFAANNPSFADNLLSALLGAEKLSELSAGDVYSDTTGYWGIRELLNSADLGRIPDMWPYGLAIISYLFTILLGFWWLRQRGLGRYGALCVVVVSFAFTAVVYALGAGTRFGGAFYRYATILEIDGDTLSQSTYVDARNPDGDTVEIRLAPGFAAKPIVQVAEAAPAERAGGYTAQPPLTTGPMGAGAQYTQTVGAIGGTSDIDGAGGGNLTDAQVSPDAQPAPTGTAGKLSAGSIANGLLPTTVIAYDAEETVITQGAVAAPAPGPGPAGSALAGFAPVYFEFDRTWENTGGLGLAADLRLSGGKLSGTVTNGFPVTVTNVSVFCLGQVIALGSIPPYGSVSVADLDALDLPVGQSRLVANVLATGDMANLYHYYLEHSREGTGARVIGTLSMDTQDARGSVSGEDGSGAPWVLFAADDFLLTGEQDVKGFTLTASAVGVEPEEGKVWRDALSRAPRVVGGQYDVGTNSIQWGEYVTLEYSLGNDMDVEGLVFRSVSEVFKNQDMLRIFSGDMYFFNYDTGNFDRMDRTRQSFGADFLAPYLSPDNAIIVRYLNGSAQGYNWNVVLPNVLVEGRR
ncbi:MAG: hypothetical protein LBR77_11670 [Lachnospiraceae bacterium]|nr:hypothetical protein [Lachnospiraceae bacterium]